MFYSIKINISESIELCIILNPTVYCRHQKFSTVGPTDPQFGPMGRRGAKGSRVSICRAAHENTLLQRTVGICTLNHRVVQVSMNMAGAGFPETSVAVYQSVRRHVPEDGQLQFVTSNY